MQRSIIFVLGLLAGLAFAFAVPSGQAHDADTLANSAPQKNPLFINMTTGDSWRGWMGLHFAHATLKQGHPVAIFLNLDAVKLAAKTGEQEKKPSMQRVPLAFLRAALVYVQASAGLGSGSGPRRPGEVSYPNFSSRRARAR